MPADFNRRDDAGSYDDLAPTYGRFLSVFGLPLARHAMSLAGIGEGSVVLDVGTGCGVAAGTAAEVVGADGLVAAVDLSGGMLSVAAGEYRDNPQLRFLQMDAQELAFRDGCFDAVIGLCSVAHFPLIDDFMVDVNRVLKVGGMAVMSFGYPRPIRPLPLAAHIFRQGGRELLRPVRPHLKAPLLFKRLAQRHLPPPDLEQTQPDWTQANPRAELRRAFDRAGLGSVRDSWAGEEHVISTAEDFWDAQTAIVTDVRKRMLNASASATASMQAEFLEEADRVVQRGGRLIYRWGALFVSGRKI